MPLTYVHLFSRADEEAARRSELEKVKREMDNQIEELKEDLEAEKSARTKAEKQRRELGEVMTVWSICDIRSDLKPQQLLIRVRRGWLHFNSQECQQSEFKNCPKFHFLNVEKQMILCKSIAKEVSLMVT